MDVACLNDIPSRKLILIEEVTINIYDINVWETSVDETFFREVKIKASFLVREKNIKNLVFPSSTTYISTWDLY